MIIEHGNSISFVSTSLSSSIQFQHSHSLVDEGISGSFYSASLVPYTALGLVYSSTPTSIIEIDSTDNSSTQIRIPSQSLNINNDLIPLYISSSAPNPLIGLGTTNPLSNLDIRSTTGSSPANLILRTNEDGVIEEGEETGRIIFAIESSSYNFNNGFNFVSSGSTAAIFSRVINAHPINGAYGSLVFEVNDSTTRTAPIEAMTIGYGLGAANTDIGFIISGAIKTTATANFLSMKSSTSNYELAYLGYSGVSDLPEFDRGMLKLSDDGNTHVRLNGAAGSTDFLNTGNNVAIGTTTAPEQLTVEGSISASGDIIGNINGGSF